MGDSLLYNKVKTALGLDRCVSAHTGAASIGSDVIAFFMGFDVNVLNAYGLSETTGKFEGDAVIAGN